MIGSKSRERYRQVFISARRNLLTWINGKGREDAIKCGILFDGTHQFYAGGLRAFKENSYTSNVELIVLREEKRAESYK